MKTPEVTIVPTGTANLASVMAAFRRVGAEPKMNARPEDVETAQYVVLPGVGDFGTSMNALRESGCDVFLQNRFKEGKPTLSICVGLQLLCKKSEESYGVKGLNIVPLAVSRFSSSVRVPQIGWNRVEPENNCRFITTGHAYFANSYRLTAVPKGWKAAWSDHGGRFVAALEKEHMLACQFHPELSGKWGLQILDRWLNKYVGMEDKHVDL